MKNIAIIFGGASVEHDISVLTGLHAARHVIDDNRVELIYLTRDGEMVTSSAMGVLSKIDNYSNKKVKKARKCYFANGGLYRVGGKKICNIDAVLNCCHGGAGENGQLAAMLDMFGVPITSCDYYSGAVLQSKSKTRKKLVEQGFDQPQVFDVITDTSIGDIVFNDEIAFPVIVKPDNLGSSIGISLAHNAEELRNAVELALSLDKSAIVEKFLESAIEVNCSAFRSGDEIQVSRCELIDKGGDVFDFDSKYLNTQSGFIKKSGRDEEYEFEEKIKSLTKKAYEIFGCRGVVRVDFLISGGQIFLNEINTVPGFLSYHLWLKSGVPYGVLIDMLVAQAQKDAKKDKKTTFESEILCKNRNLVE